MVSLLVGHDKPTIAKMSQAEQQSASEFGYRLATQAMGGAPIAGGNPHAYQGLADSAPVFGQTRGAVRAGGLSDPRDEAASVPGQARSHYHTGRYLVSGTDDEVRQRYQTGRDNQVLTEARQRAQLNEVRRETLGQQIQEQGQLPQSLPAWTVEHVGGFLKDIASYGRAVGFEFPADTMAAMGRAVGAISAGQGLQGAVSAAGEDWGKARQEMMDVRLAAVRGTGERQLTEEQMDLYRAALDSYFPHLDGVQRFVGTDLASARERLVAKEGPIGDAMANILISAAVSQQDSGLAPLRAYNQAETSQEKLRAQIEDLEKKSAEPRGGRVGGVMSDPEGAAAMVQTARRLGLEPVEFVAMMSWESGGTLNPNKLGGDGGAYRGLIQFSPENQQRYGIREGQSIAEQMPAVERYLLDRGFMPGEHTIEHAYSAVLAGNASEKYWDRQDSNGTSVRNAAEKFRSGTHVDRAVKFLRNSLS
jgi:hypothetical protein